MRKIRDFKTIRKDYLEKAAVWNGNLMLFVSLFCILVELFNIVRVLGFSKSGLGTLNNRIYFSFYTALLLMGLLYVATDLVLRRKGRTLVYYRCSMAGAALVFLWQTLFQIYDISSSSASGYITIVAAFVAFSSMVVMRPIYAIVNLLVNYGIFLCAVRDSGDRFNFTIMLLLCIVIYLVKYKTFLIGLFRERELESMHHELDDKTDKLRLSNEQYELLARSSNLIAFQWNIEEDWVHFAPNRATEFRWPDRIEHFQQTVRDSQLIREESKHIIYHCLQKARQEIPHQKYELLLPSKTGEEKWYEFQLALQKDRSGRPFLGFGFLSNIMKQKEKIAKLEEEIQKDSFTQLLNKAAVERRGEEMLNALKEGKYLYKLIGDIDDFKTVNDQYGHICGDHVLKSTAEVLSGLAAENVVTGRLGGDEFIALAVGNENEEPIKEYAGRILPRVKEIEWNGNKLNISMSIGIASARRGESSFGDLYTAADEALYMAKRQGKGRFAFFRKE